MSLRPRRVRHEIDLFAVAKGNATMVECKYHNYKGVFTGLKEAMYTYAQECDDPVEADYWLRKTACEGHAQAMYDYAMCRDEIKERRRWLMRAANQGWEAAIEALDTPE